MVFGMISEKTRMSTVRPAENHPRAASPNCAAAIAPTLAAPAVLAMVLTVRIAEMGLSMSCLYFFKRSAVFEPSSSFMVTKDIGVESKDASSTEQVNDAKTTKNKSAKSGIIVMKMQFTNDEMWRNFTPASFFS